MTRFAEGPSAIGRSSWMRLLAGALFLTALPFMGFPKDASAQVLEHDRA
jgi:hypothetical protein